MKNQVEIFLNIKKTTLAKPPLLSTYLPQISNKKKSLTNSQSLNFNEPQFQTLSTDSNYLYSSNNPYISSQQMQEYNYYNYNSTPYLPILNPSLSYNSIDEFLESLGENFLEYENNFIDHGYSVTELPYLNMEQLKGIGIVKLGQVIVQKILVTLGLPIV